MGFNKCYVQSFEKVHEQYLILGLKKFQELYKNRDSFIGPTDAITFILSKLTENI
jgi:hypothetical protein